MLSLTKNFLSPSRAAIKLNYQKHFPPFVFDSPSTTVNEAKKQRKEAKLIKELDKQKEEEASEREQLEQSLSKKGNWLSFYSLFTVLCE